MLRRFAMPTHNYRNALIALLILFKVIVVIPLPPIVS